MCASPSPLATSHRHSPLWLSHHWPEHYDRCVRVGRFDLCRRCVVLYPLAALTIVAMRALDASMSDALIAAMWILPVPMVAEWVAEHRGRASYSPPRQMAFAALAAPALGIALTEHLRHPFAPVATVPVVVYGTVCAVSALAASRHRSAADLDWESVHEGEEAARHAALVAMLSEVDEPSDATEPVPPTPDRSGTDRDSDSPLHPPPRSATASPPR